MEVLGLVLEVMQRLQGVLQALVLELLMVVGAVVVVVLEVAVVVLVQPLLGHVTHKTVGLVLQKLLKFFEGLLVCDKPFLWRPEMQMLDKEPGVESEGGGACLPLSGRS